MKWSRVTNRCQLRVHSHTDVNLPRHSACCCYIWWMKNSFRKTSWYWSGIGMCSCIKETLECECRGHVEVSALKLNDLFIVTYHTLSYVLVRSSGSWGGGGVEEGRRGAMAPSCDPVKDYLFCTFDTKQTIFPHFLKFKKFPAPSPSHICLLRSQRLDPILLHFHLWKCACIEKRNYLRFHTSVHIVKRNMCRYCTSRTLPLLNDIYLELSTNCPWANLFTWGFCWKFRWNSLQEPFIEYHKNNKIHILYLRQNKE